MLVIEILLLLCAVYATYRNLKTRLKWVSVVLIALTGIAIGLLIRAIVNAPDCFANSSDELCGLVQAVAIALMLIVVNILAALQIVLFLARQLYVYIKARKAKKATNAVPVATGPVAPTPIQAEAAPNVVVSTDDTKDTPEVKREQ